MLAGLTRKKFTLTEDMLTSVVLSYLELLPPSIFAEWLQRARAAPQMESGFSLGNSPSIEAHPWPRTRRFGEPDLLLMIQEGEVLHAVVMEMKYGALKSQWASYENRDDEEGRASHDQLARYGRALRVGDFFAFDAERIRRARHAVIYVTTDAAPPHEELRESLERDPNLLLYWVSWHALAEVLEAAHSNSDIEERARAAFLKLLTELGFGAFRGFLDAGAASVQATYFYEFQRSYFSHGRAVDRLLGWNFQAPRTDQEGS